LCFWHGPGSLDVMSTDELNTLRPGDDDYDTERAGFQRAVEHRPALIVRATGPDDVRAAVELAGAQGRPVAVKATGHGVTVGADDTAVLVTTDRMTGVSIDSAARTAYVEAGVRWGEVIEQAAAHGLAPLSGSSPDVGAIAYTLGGGLGLMSRCYGYAADHVRSVDVVTADGQARHVTPDSDADLFWALRGGRDNFGVVTGLEVELVPVTRLYGGGVYFAAEHVRDVVEAYRRWTDTVPEELTSSIGLVPFPDLPMVPEPLRGRYVAHVRIAYLGDKTTGEELVAPLRATAPRLIDRVEDMPYTASGSIHNDPTQPHAYYGTSLMLRSLDADAARTLLDLAGPDAPIPTVVQLRHLGGALTRPSSVPNSVGHRDAELLLGVISFVEGDTGPNDDLQARLQDALAPVTAGTNLNYLYGPAATPEAVRAAYEPDDYRRLTELKRVYDPTNTFRLNNNIPPAG
jgi:FAD/FMN-containing dehydrogenase